MASPDLAAQPKTLVFKEDEMRAEKRVMFMYVIFYAILVDSDKEGVFVDGPFFGGEAHTPQMADCIAKDLSNDRTLSGAVIPKVLKRNEQNRKSVLRVARRYFDNIARDVYDQADILDRSKR